jgi:hemolysin activation/secretion protein
LHGSTRRAASICILLSAAATVLAPIAAWSQALPDAGSVLRQIEEQQGRQLPPAAPPEIAPAPPPLESIGGATVTVTEFRFAGNSLISSDELAPHVAQYVGRPLDFAELQNAAIAVATAYREADWVVRAYLPRQDVTAGIITIQIVEATFGRVRFEGDPKRTSTEQLRRIVENAQEPGAPVNAARLDRSVLLINDLPGVTATGRLAAGIDETETDLLVNVDDGPLVNGGLEFDNAGARHTGETRLIGTAHLNNRLGLGDRADAVLLHSEGSDYVRLAYALSIGSRGWRVGANASQLDYEIVSDEFAQLDAHGDSTTLGLDASYPLIRSRATNLYLTFAVDEARFDNKSASVTTTRYSTQAATVGVYANRFDRLKGGGVTSAGAALVRGTVDLAGSPNAAADAATTRVDGSFGKLSLTASRLQMLTERLSLFGGIERQLANKNLDSSQKMYLGGAQGVRAHPESEAGGAQGTLVTLELRARVAPSINVTTFYDRGEVDFNQDNDFLGAPELNTVELKGFGVAVGWTSTFGLLLQATVARRSGANPNAMPSGDDQDGSLVENRVWLQVSMPF